MMLIIHDVQYFNYATVHFTDDHPTDDLENYFDWELEPAPPKDWDPWCFVIADNETLNHRCGAFASGPQCIDCPHDRKLED